MGISLDLLGSLVGVVRSKITELVTLLVDDIADVFNLVVNDFAVLDVDEGGEKQDSVGHEG